MLWPTFPLGIGTGRLCSLNGGLPVSAATRLLKQAYDLGIRFVDTAPSYGQGQSEEAIGKLDSSMRDDLLICTKVGYSIGSKGRWINLAKPLVQPILPRVGTLRGYFASARDRAGQTGGSMTVTIEPATVLAALDGSLRRLRRDYVDLYMMHDPSIESLADSTSQQVFNDLVQQGKIRCWGISTSDGEVARRATAVPGCSVIEMPGFPSWVAANRDAYQSCVEHNTQVIVNGVLSPLTGHAHGDISPGPAMSAKKCIKYALELPNARVVLCGARQAKNLTENVNIVRQLISE